MGAAGSYYRCAIATPDGDLSRMVVPGYGAACLSNNFPKGQQTL